MIFHLAIRLFILAWFHVVYAQRNVTFDDRDPSIVYAPAGAWVQSQNDTLDFGGGHMLTQNPNATATFKFTGVAIYFLSPKWPYEVNTAVSLDSGPLFLIDLVDHTSPSTGQGPETVQSAVVWNATGLNDTQHTLVISVGPGQSFGIVDGLIYTDPTLSPSTTTSSPPSPSTSSSPSPTLSEPVVAPVTSDTGSAASVRQIHILPIVLGSLFGVLGLIVIVLALLYFRRRKRPVSEAWTVAGMRYSSPTSGGPANTPPMTNVTNSHWNAAQSYPQGYPMEQTQQGAWQNSRYGYVGMPAPAIPPQPYNGAYHGGYAYDQDPQTMAPRAPNRYQPGYTLSTITEKSTPRMAETNASLANSPASLQSDLGYYTAPASEGMSSTGSVSRRPYFASSPKVSDYSSEGRAPEKPPQPRSSNWM
ncbi:hypothetical protein BDZ97DRAFT_1755965 [Flammula alnicola]|nr:hypothetical protein BDZ97DRAFT_1755965 [Flammula alnicola]